MLAPSDREAPRKWYVSEGNRRATVSTFASERPAKLYTIHMRAGEAHLYVPAHAGSHVRHGQNLDTYISKCMSGEIYDEKSHACVAENRFRRSLYIGCVLYSAAVGPRSFRAGLPVYRGALPKLTQRCSTSFVPAYGRRTYTTRILLRKVVRQLRKTAAQAFLTCSLE